MNKILAITGLLSPKLLPPVPEVDDRCHFSNIL